MVVGIYLAKKNGNMNFIFFVYENTVLVYLNKFYSVNIILFSGICSFISTANTNSFNGKCYFI